MGGSLLSAWERLADLQVEVESVSLGRLTQDVSTGFTRVTTVVQPRGGGCEGAGEDVTYTAADHDGFPLPELTGTAALGELWARVEAADLFASPPDMDASRDYRLWGVESALLDLALQQAGTSLAAVLGRELQPLTFVVSTRLGDQSSTAPLRRYLELYPNLRFKLDPAPDWDDALVTELHGLGAVDAVDLKGQYHGTVVDMKPDPVLYRRVAEGFPDAWIEDPGLTPETDAALEPFRDRITWDAPIHSVADVEKLPFAPRCLNVKPSRFGSVEALFRFYDYCADHGIALYGGGQFELGVGRGQIQYLASMLHPDTGNDVAPGAFNEPEPRPGLPTSPLALIPAATGFRLA